MRTSGVLFAAIAVTILIPTYTHGQSSDPRALEEQPEPYHKHHDTRQGHDHFYPDRGSIVREVPQGASVVNYAGLSYRFHDGVWFEPRGPAFMVVAPPIGLVVTTLPTFATVLAHGGELYLYCNDVYYQPRPDLSGYEVINDPAETPVKAKADAAVVAPAAGKTASVPRAAATPSVAAATTAEDDNGEPAVVTPAAIPVAKAVGGTTAASITGPGPPASMMVAAAPMTLPASSTAPAAVGAPAAVPVNAVMRSTPLPSLGPSSPITAAATAPPGAGPGVGPTAVAPIPTPTSSSTSPTAGAPGTTVVAATTVTPPPASSSTAPPDPPKGIRASLAPKSGQTADQLAHDRYDCYRFAVAQTGFDPVRSGTVASPAATQQQYDYDRAQSACFEARGYSVH